MSNHEQTDTHGVDPDSREPPKNIWSTLKSLGPGMILTGSIVGSGELIATTKVGAETGFWLLWIIIVGCVIKVFTQIEFGRYTVTHSETTLKALNSIPGPRLKVNWIVWLWLAMTVFSVGQLGGIVGAIGQSLAMTVPITAEGRQYNEAQNKLINSKIRLAELISEKGSDDAPSDEDIAAQQATVLGFMNIQTDPDGAYLTNELGEYKLAEIQRPTDAPLWGSLVAILTALILYAGRYRFIKIFSTILVVGFTIVTMITLALLQGQPSVAISASELMNGLSFSLPPDPTGLKSLVQRFGPALSAFGIIGVGAAELIMYPYWCLEQGYAKSTGKNDGSAAWLKRAKGWMSVLYTDAWLSMIIYTASTIAFLLLGAAVLHRIGLNPDGGDLIRVLSEMYVPVFGEWARPMFLVGAIAVLYSTFMIGSDGNSRLTADCLGLFGFHKNDEESHAKWTRKISLIWPLACMAVFLLVSNNPATLVLAAGSAQAMMLPILGFAALYFRYKKCHDGLKPTLVFDALLALSVLGFITVGGYKLAGIFAG